MLQQAIDAVLLAVSVPPNQQIIIEGALHKAYDLGLSHNAAEALHAAGFGPQTSGNDDIVAFFEDRCHYVGVVKRCVFFFPVEWDKATGQSLQNTIEFNLVRLR